MNEEQRTKLRKRIKSLITEVKYPGTLTHCWIWPGATAGRGYPVFKLDGKRVSVRRLAYLLFGVFGAGKQPQQRLPPPGNRTLRVLCGHHDCVNPRHMKLGSPKGGRPKEKK